MSHTFTAKVSTGTFLVGLAQCKVVMTVDSNLIGSPASPVAIEPDKLLHLEPIESFKRDLYVKDLTVCMTYSKKGVIFSSNKEIRLTFTSHGEVEAFRQAFLSQF